MSLRGRDEQAQPARKSQALQGFSFYTKENVQAMVSGEPLDGCVRVCLHTLASMPLRGLDLGLSVARVAALTVHTASEQGKAHA